MTAIIKIAGVDRSTSVVSTTVILNRALTSQVDTISFDVVRAGGVAGGGYKPNILDTLEVLENGVTIFGGQIVTVNEEVQGKDLEIFHCSGKDYSFDMDRYLVVGTFENMTVEDIIDSINTEFLPAGYDISNVICPVVVNYISFNYELPSKVFQQLADLTNSDWYVDDQKKIFFFLKNALPAPFNLDDSNENFYYNTLKIQNDLKSLRNSIIVRGGQYLGLLRGEKQVADGQTSVFLQGYQYNSLYVKVGGVSKTVGIDNIDSPTSVDVLYNFNEKAVKFPDASKPTSGQIVEVGGLPYIPVIVRLKDSDSIRKFGEYEFKIIDKTINSKEGARDRAAMEIKEWSEQVSDGSFETNKGGLQVGQSINVSSVIRGYNQDYVISRISTKLTNGLEFLHSVTLMTTQTYGIIEFLQKLLIEKDKEIVINKDEVLEFITELADGMTFTDAINSITKTSGPYLWDTAIWDYAVWG